MVRHLGLRQCMLYLSNEYKDYKKHSFSLRNYKMKNPTQLAQSLLVSRAITHSRKNSLLHSCFSTRELNEWIWGNNTAVTITPQEN